MLLYKLSMQFIEENPSRICNTVPKGKVRKLKRKSAKSSSAVANKIFLFDVLLITFTTICLPSSESDDGKPFPILVLGWKFGFELQIRIGFFFNTKSVRGVFESKDSLRRSATYTTQKKSYIMEKNKIDSRHQR
jgi:hypothetical protein